VKLAKDLLDVNENLVVVAEGLPYDIERFPGVPAYIATYAYNRWNSPAGGHDLMTEVTAKLLAGEINPGGSLPVPVESIDGK
jgi:beta-N-acetylhexosaminidase